MCRFLGTDSSCCWDLICGPDRITGHTGHMAKLSLGGVHSAVLDDAGVAYTFGDNSRGQCVAKGGIQVFLQMKNHRI